MCSINGFNSSNESQIKKMNSQTNHRGPDQTTFWVGEGISLGHNRLSIIDLTKRASQPMWDEKKEICIVYNGELYNFQDIKKELEKDFTFFSDSDTEVILCAFKKWGIECVKKFNGMFAFAIWDTRSKDLWIARDHMGIKPLVYYYKDGAFIFSSEIKGILTHDIPRAVDMDAFNLYLRVLYIPEPYTMFRGINKLPSAHYLHLDKSGKCTIKKYWEQTDFSNTKRSKEETRQKIRAIFDDSVKRQLVSDRPIGVFLSGGIDSTAVLGSVMNHISIGVKTFSVGFDVEKQHQDKFNADLILAKKTSEYYKTSHTELMISAQDIQNNIKDIIRHLGEPNFNPTAAAQYLLSKRAKSDVAVVLGGEGGDELFGGYPRYYYSKIISDYQLIPNIARKCIEVGLSLSQKNKLVKKLSTKQDLERVLTFLSQKEDLISEIINKQKNDTNITTSYFRKKYFNSIPVPKDFEKYFMNIDRQSWLVDESLFRTDTMTMAAGLEMRVPILDRRLVELSNHIPTRWKMHLNLKHPQKFQGKDIWKDAISDYIPEFIFTEKKRGWFTPMAKWLRVDMYNFVNDILSPENIQTDFFSPDEITKMWQNHISGKKYNLNMIWAITTWHLWYDEFIKK